MDEQDRQWRGLLVHTDDFDRAWFPRPKSKPIAADELEEEPRKLETLCWDNGFRHDDNGLNHIERQFSRLIEEHLDQAVDARQRGRLKAPKPSFEAKSTSRATLLKGIHLRRRLLPITIH